MKIKEALAAAITQLEASSPTPDVDALYLLAHVLNSNTAWIFLHSDDALSETHDQAFSRLIALRAQGLPIAYLTKTRGFWALDFIVDERVLIPRPETELLIELTLQVLPKDPICKVADLGTGSGAIALSLAHERKHWQIDAVDQSSDALTVAKLNAKQLELPQVNFYCGSWCQPLPSKDYDAIISNPPYLANDDPHLAQGDLRFEPQKALASGTTGLEAYAEIIATAKDYLKDQGLLILEHGFEQRDALVAMLAAHEYQELQVFDDYQGLARVVMATRPLKSLKHE
jgi:release factor glutamine methyltransferase